MRWVFYWRWYGVANGANKGGPMATPLVSSERSSWCDKPGVSTASLALLLPSLRVVLVPSVTQELFAHSCSWPRPDRPIIPSCWSGQVVEVTGGSLRLILTFADLNPSSRILVWNPYPSHTCHIPRSCICSIIPFTTSPRALREGVPASNTKSNTRLDSTDRMVQ